MIRVATVRVVDEDGSQLGVMPTAEALAMAQERGLDLVEVAPMAAPPVVRFLDFGQYKYELTKREKEAKRKQRSVTFKEVRLKPKIGIGDFDTKVRRAIQFLEEGDRIKVAVQFRGRELTHPDIGRNLLTKFVDRIKDHGVVERSPLLEGKSMHITVASTHKPKSAETPARQAEADDGSVQKGVPAAAASAMPAPAAVVAPSAVLAPSAVVAPVTAPLEPPATVAAKAPVAVAPAAEETAEPTKKRPTRTVKADGPTNGPVARPARAAKKTTAAAPAVAAPKAKPAARTTRQKTSAPGAPAAATTGE
jgi:translation initiation factor IF-3